MERTGSCCKVMNRQGVPPWPHFGQSPGSSPGPGATLAEMGKDWRAWRSGAGEEDVLHDACRRRSESERSESRRASSTFMDRAAEPVSRLVHDHLAWLRWDPPPSPGTPLARSRQGCLTLACGSALPRVRGAPVGWASDQPHRRRRHECVAVQIAELISVSLDDINIPPGNHRQDLGDLNGLAESIRTIGLVQPTTVRRDGTGGYQLVAGQRRARRREARRTDGVPALCAATPTLEAARPMAAENLHRKDLVTWRPPPRIRSCSISASGMKRSPPSPAPRKQVSDTLPC